MDLLGNIWYNIFKTTLHYTDPYGGYGSYAEVKCPKCGGVGWVPCSFCFGDGTILVLE